MTDDEAKMRAFLEVVEKEAAKLPAKHRPFFQHSMTHAYHAGYNKRISEESDRGLDKLLTQVMNRRVTIEQRMFDAAAGKRSMPTSEELRQWAIELGTPGGAR